MRNSAQQVFTPNPFEGFEIKYVIWFYRILLEEKVQEFVNNEKEKRDIRKTIVMLLFIIFGLTLFGGIFQTNIQFITSQHAYINGENVNYRFSEIMKLKELLEKGVMDFWSSDNSLGYPLLMTTQPLPSFSAALLVLVVER